MKVAILLAGHMRAWNYCRSNFMENLYNANHQIDVFCDTYNQVFRSDYKLHNECDMQVTLTDEEIKSQFTGINVVNFDIEPEQLGHADLMQKRKLLRVFDSYNKHVAQHGEYDLCIKSRFDILLHKPFDYESVLNECNNNSKLIFISDGGVPVRENDMFAATKPEAFDIYMNRLNIIQDGRKEYAQQHWSMHKIELTHGIQYNNSIHISIVRLDGNGNFREFYK